MPVLSPHRSSTSAATSTLPATYRSSYSSSSLVVDRPYHHYSTTGAGSTSSASSYVPRYNGGSTYESRYYSDSTRESGGGDGVSGAGRRSFTSRASSILEDSGTRYHREERREMSITSRSGVGDPTTSIPSAASERFGSIRENAILDSYQPSLAMRSSLLSGGSREGSRDRGVAGLGTTSVLESVADFRNKYSPSNYVPKVMRSRERNGLLVDVFYLLDKHQTNTKITQPKPSCAVRLFLLQITTTSSAVAAAATTASSSSPASNNTSNNTNTNHNDQQDDGDDDSRMRSVSEIRRHFDRLSQSQERELSPKLTVNNNSVVNVMNQQFHSSIKDRTLLTEKIDQQITSNGCVTNGFDFDIDGASINGKGISLLTNGHNHTSDFASYIPAKVTINGESVTESSNNKPVVAEEVAVVDDTRAEEYANLLNGSSSGDAAQSTLLDGQQMMDRRFHHSKASPANEISSTARNSTSISGRPSPDLNTSGTIAGGATTNYSSSNRTSAIAASSASATATGLNGLKNIGNTCFMNSVLQCLSNTRPLLEYMRKDCFNGDINTTISGMKGALVKAFAQLIKDLWSDECIVNTTSLKSQIQRFAPRFMGYAQQDAQEFLRYLLEGLHEDVNRVTSKPTPLTQDIDDRLPDGEKAQEAWQRYTRMDNSKIVDLFVGQLKSSLKCTHCGHCSVTFDPFWDLSLPIPSRTGQLRLSQCLDSFTREETLDGDEKPTCSKCKERRKCTKSFSIQRFPKILVIHLKRFSPMERFRGKLSCTVDFPLESLDMSNYAADAKSSQCRYNLYAISNHSGTTYSGHYTAYCKHPYTGAWHEYNDSRVSSISSRSLVSGEAYVLFYELDSGSQRAHL